MLWYVIFLFSTFPFSNFLLKINLNTFQLSYTESLIGCFPNFLPTFCRTFYWNRVKCRDKYEKKKMPVGLEKLTCKPILDWCLSKTGLWLIPISAMVIGPSWSSTSFPVKHNHLCFLENLPFHQVFQIYLYTNLPHSFLILVILSSHFCLNQTWQRSVD